MTIAATPLEKSETTTGHSSPRPARGDDTPESPSDDHPKDTLAAESTIESRIAAFAEGEYSRVVSAVSLWSGSIDDASDAVADALGKAWEDLDKGTSIHNLAAYVTTAAMNRVRSQHRRRALARRKGHLLTVAAASEPAEATVRRLDVATALGTLTKRQRNVVALRYGADLTVAEIAGQLGIAEGTVKATLHQARAILAEHFEAKAKGASND